MRVLFVAVGMGVELLGVVVRPSKDVYPGIDADHAGPADRVGQIREFVPTPPAHLVPGQAIPVLVGIGLRIIEPGPGIELITDHGEASALPSLAWQGRQGPPCLHAIQVHSPCFVQEAAWILVLLSGATHMPGPKLCSLTEAAGCDQRVVEDPSAAVLESLGQIRPLFPGDVEHPEQGRCFVWLCHVFSSLDSFPGTPHVVASPFAMERNEGGILLSHRE